MLNFTFFCTLLVFSSSTHDCVGQEIRQQLVSHPKTTHFAELFKRDLSNAIADPSIWTFDKGVLTASEDQAIWTSKVYERFILDLEFKTAEGTNSGVIFHCTDLIDWIPNSVEVQIADDYAEQWSSSPATWQCGAIFGHLAPVASLVRKPGRWNRMSIQADGQLITVILNGEIVTEMDMSLWTSPTTNPDGSEIPSWLSTPFAELPTYGHIGLQGKHAGAPIYFRNLKIREF